MTMPAEAMANGLQDLIDSVTADIVPTTMVVAAVVDTALCPNGSHQRRLIEIWTQAVARPGDLID